MKLIIQIPCFNEEADIPKTLAEIPRKVDGFDSVEILIIDDGSSDRTSSVAREAHADHIVRHPQNLGLASAFETGLNTALELGADVIVNTDADNQYNSADIPKLTAPILAGEAEIVVGARPIDSIRHFSPVKKLLQKIGSAVVRQMSSSSVEDAPSGFRAYSRDAAMRIHIFSTFTYTLETIIQAGLQRIAITSVPIRVNGETRPSRLFRGSFNYVLRSVSTMVRIYTVYQPLRFFGLVRLALFLPGLAIGARFAFHYFLGSGDGKVQSLILCVVLVVTSAIALMAGLLSDLIAANRKLHEQTAYLEKKRLYARNDRTTA